MTLSEIRQRLEALSAEMSAIIRTYHLTAVSPLEVIANARAGICDSRDYTKFLELSLEGRILADEGERLMKAEQVMKGTLQ